MDNNVEWVQMTRSTDASRFLFVLGMIVAGCAGPKLSSSPGEDARSPVPDATPDDRPEPDARPPGPLVGGPWPVIHGGRGGHIYRITNLDDRGAGSLRDCIVDVEDRGARICVFEVSGVINLGSDLEISKPHITIAGQTSPDGIMLRGWSLWITASHVLVQHLAVRVGDASPGPDSAVHNAIIVVGRSTQPVSDVVIDHCSVSWTMDQTATAWDHWNNVTFSNNIFAQPLNDSFHVADDGGYEPHGVGPILGGVQGGRVVMVGNLMAHQAGRNPLSTAREIVLANNLVYNWGSEGTQIDSRGDGQPILGSLVGNHYVAGPDTTSTPIKMFWGSPPPGTQVYLVDNQAAGSSSDPWDPDVVQIVGDGSIAAIKAASAVAWPTDLVALPTQNNAVFHRVLAYAGARPAFRDSVDLRVVDEVRNGTGEIINCVSADGSARCEKNAGGWPIYGEGTRRFDVADPAGDSDGNGYTNLEDELHRLAALVEGL